MEKKAKSLEEIALGAPFLRWPIFGFWLRGQNVVSPTGEISSVPLYAEGGCGDEKRGRPAAEEAPTVAEGIASAEEDGGGISDQDGGGISDHDGPAALATESESALRRRILLDPRDFGARHALVKLLHSRARAPGDVFSGRGTAEMPRTSESLGEQQRHLRAALECAGVPGAARADMHEEAINRPNMDWQE